MHSTTDLLHCTNLVVSFSSAYGLPAEDNTTQTAQFDRSHSFYLRHSRGDYDVSRDDMCSGERGTLAVDDESRHPVMRPYKSTITATSYAGRIWQHGLTDVSNKLVQLFRHSLREKVFFYAKVELHRLKVWTGEVFYGLRTNGRWIIQTGLNRNEG